MVTLLDHVQVTQRQGLVLVIFLLGSQHLAQGLDRSRGSMKTELKISFLGWPSAQNLIKATLNIKWQSLPKY